MPNEVIPNKCVCGAEARIRYRYPYTWVECKNKKCHIFSGYVSDISGEYREECKQFAIELWNKKVSRNG